MLGWMTAKEAKAHGFTHHGDYLGIPIWIGDIDSEAPMVATKAVWLEPVMSFAHIVEQLMLPIVDPDAEPSFQFRVRGEIEA